MDTGQCKNCPFLQLLTTHKMKQIILDCEVYPNFFLVAVKRLEDGKTKTFIDGFGKTINKSELEKLLNAYELITFNGIGFDLPVITGYLNGHKPYEICCDIIEKSMRHWHIEKEYNFKVAKYEHIDLMEIAVGQTGLKSYGARLHTKELENLPIEPGTELTLEEAEKVAKYCLKDLTLTEQLYKHLLPQIELRRSMTEMYKLDLKSKSDAQIGEAVIKKMVEVERGSRVERTTPEKTLYKHAKWVKFKDDKLNDLVKTTYAKINELNNPKNLYIVKVFKKAVKQNVVIAGKKYAFGIGGLHSQEKAVMYESTKTMQIIDRDVTSYYPSIILNEKLSPSNMNPEFISVYRNIVDMRVKAKKNKDTVTNEALKVSINGSYGKFGSSYSILYAPHLMVQVCLCGQFGLLMLIEMLENAGIPVISANTDGIVMLVDKAKKHEYNEVIHEWESITHFNTEETFYSDYIARDVNNYIAVKNDGTIKVKGIFTKPGLAKAPANYIIYKAVVNWMVFGIPTKTTINNCKDIRDFITVKNVTGGAVTHEGEILGKVVRFYWSVDGESLHYYKQGNKVPTSEGAKAVMNLPDELPNDIDYQRYINEAEKICKIWN